MVPCIDPSQRLRAEARTRKCARFKSHLIVNLRLVVWQRQEGAVVVAADVLSLCAVVWRWMRRRRARRRIVVGAGRARRNRRDDCARGGDEGISAGPRSRRLQLHIFEGELARVAFSAVNAAGRLYRTFQPAERDVPAKNTVAISMQG